MNESNELLDDESKDKEDFIIQNLEQIIRILIITGAGIVLIVTAIYFSHFSSDANIDYESWGQIGDFFGGTLNPIFSFLALIAILVSLNVQGKELMASIAEMKKDHLINLKSVEIQKQTAELNGC